MARRQNGYLSTVGRAVTLVCLLAMFFGFVVVTFAPPAVAASTASVCPSQASVKSRAGWQNILGTYDTRDFSAQTGTLAGCAASVSVVNLPAIDYYLYFDAQTVSGLDLFGGGNVLSFSVTGAPGATGWYVQAFDSVTGTLLDVKNYGAGAATRTSSGHFNYEGSLRLSDGTTTIQPSLASGATLANPSPTYTVTYGFTPSQTQRANIEAGSLAIYIGYLGSSNATNKDILESVRLNYFLPETALAPRERPSIPSIGLNVEAVVGSPINGRAVDYVGYRMQPGSGYSVLLQPGGTVLASGTVGSNGDFSGRPSLGNLSPGSYSVTLKAVGDDGKSYQLIQRFVVGANSVVESISTPTGSISTGASDRLARTGGPGLEALQVSIGLISAGLWFLALRRLTSRHRVIQ